MLVVHTSAEDSLRYQGKTFQYKGLSDTITTAPLYLRYLNILDIIILQASYQHHCLVQQELPEKLL